MKLALLSITGAAALSGVTTTTDWTAARSALRQRDVGAVVVEGAAAPAHAWRGAMEGDACAAVDVSCEACDCAVAAVQSAFAPLWGAADEVGAAAAQIVDLARCYDRCLADKSDGGRVRVRATVTRGRATAPCPKLHTDFVALRGLVALEGPGTVVAPEVNLAVSNLMPAWMVARMDRAEGAATVSPARDAFLLVKGESWGFGQSDASRFHLAAPPPPLYTSRQIAPTKVSSYTRSVAAGSPFASAGAVALHPTQARLHALAAPYDIDPHAHKRRGL